MTATATGSRRASSPPCATIDEALRRANFMLGNGADRVDCRRRRQLGIASRTGQGSIESARIVSDGVRCWMRLVQKGVRLMCLARESGALESGADPRLIGHDRFAPRLPQSADCRVAVLPRVQGLCRPDCEDILSNWPPGKPCICVTDQLIATRGAVGPPLRVRPRSRASITGRRCRLDPGSQLFDP